MLGAMVLGVQRRMTVAAVVGLLTFGAPAPRAVTLAGPPAVVRVQVSSPGAEAWRALFPARPAPN
jgi:hypothetical protein